MIDESFDTERPLDFKLLFAQKKAEKVKALKEAKALEAARACAEQDLTLITSTVINTDIPVPLARDEKHISPEKEEEEEEEEEEEKNDDDDDDDIKSISSINTKAEKSKSIVDSKNETSSPIAYTSSTGKPIGLDSQFQCRSSTNPKPLKRESCQPALQLDVSQPSTILKSIDPDKRRFFRPLADAITASSADQLGKILLRLCVEYPDARAVVESLLANTNDEDIIDSPPTLIRKTSINKVIQAPRDPIPGQKVTMTPLPPLGKQNRILEEEQRSHAIAKSAIKVPKPSPNPKSVPTRTPVVASGKRKKEDSPDTSFAFQKKSNPYYVIPKRSKLDGSSDHRDGISPPKPSSKSLNASERSQSKNAKPSSESLSKTKPVKSPSESPFDSGDSDDEPLSGKRLCTVAYCLMHFASQCTLDRHMKTVHRSEGEPFGCSLCHKKFARRDYVYRHLDAAHTSSDSKCIPCGLKYLDGDSLSAHMRSEHGVKHIKNTTTKEPSSATTHVKRVSFQEDSMNSRKS